MLPVPTASASMGAAGRPGSDPGVPQHRTDPDECWGHSSPQHPLALADTERNLLNSPRSTCFPPTSRGSCCLPLPSGLGELLSSAAWVFRLWGDMPVLLVLEEENKVQFLRRDSNSDSPGLVARA